MKRIFCLAAVLALCLSGAALAAETPDPMLEGPLYLSPSIDPESLLYASVSFTYPGDPGLILAFEIGADKGEATGEIGELRQFMPSATMEVGIHNVRYLVLPAPDGKSMMLSFSMDCTVDGKTQQFTDTLTLRPGMGQEPELVVESPKGGEAVPVNG